MITTVVFIFAFFTKFKWIPILLGVIMASVTVISIFLKEIPLQEYFDEITIGFWIAFVLALGFGGYFLLNLEKWWAGFIAAISIVILVLLTLVDVLIYGKFPLLPGANISLIFFTSLLSMSGMGIVVGKTFSDKKNGYCIPFLEDCAKYECEKIGKCKKI